MTTSTLQIGDIVYMVHPEMAHAERPMIIMRLRAGEAMMMPLSTSAMRAPYSDFWMGSDYETRGCTARGHMAPNRVWRLPASSLPTPSGAVTSDEVHLAWECWQEYITPVRR